MPTKPIVVGYDGSAGARSALRWALGEAARHPAAVHLVHAVERPLRAVPTPLMPGELYPTDEHHVARAMLDHAIAEAAGANPMPVEITGAVLDGPPATVLCEQSQRAGLLVLGGRGLGGFAGLFVGSVSLAVATHARCPVVVVREGESIEATDRPIAVGVDDSAEAQLAIGFAMQEAAARGVDLVAVHAWSPPRQPWRSDVRPLVQDVAELESAEQHLTSKAMRGWQAKYPDVEISTRLIPTDARHALAKVSHEVQLVVVGARGRGGFGGLLLGSVGHYLLHHAACPVAIVRETRSLSEQSDGLSTAPRE
jgi:nucleotide-binding universal stress UspA family protein